MSIFDEGYNQAVLGITRQPVVRPPAGRHGKGELVAKRIKIAFTSYMPGDLHVILVVIGGPVPIRTPLRRNVEGTILLSDAFAGRFEHLRE